MEHANIMVPDHPISKIGGSEEASAEERGPHPLSAKVNKVVKYHTNTTECWSLSSLARHLKHSKGGGSGNVTSMLEVWVVLMALTFHPKKTHNRSNLGMIQKMTMALKRVKNKKIAVNNKKKGLRFEAHKAAFLPSNSLISLLESLITTENGHVPPLGIIMGNPWCYEANLADPYPEPI
ncbi:hypothetical protein EV421DRAFT_1733896 [Armillaria borealis]|uniref:Uncharacterized protein n=1 Tax=Armillaria borealis TaxID=47425 RepID=A0AA39MUK9_9AGAR|nr:hypothetical protein EV421DRAFT_1733896 [Armillaria borealis]